MENHYAEAARAAEKAIAEVERILKFCSKGSELISNKVILRKGKVTRVYVVESPSGIQTTVIIHEGKHA